MRKLALIALALGLFGLNAANASNELDKKTAEVRSQVAANFFDPGPSLIMKLIAKVTFYNTPDLGMNLTSLTEYQAGDVLFPSGLKSTNIEQSYDSLAQFVVLRDIRHYFDNPANLQAVYGQVKQIAIPALLHKVGNARANTWLSPAEDLFRNAFKDELGKSYESWRTGGCQWYLQVDPSGGYTPKLSKDECSKHPFVKAIGVGAVSGAGALVNRAHWYGFLWRRHLEGDTALVKVWQVILSDILKAARSQS